MQQDSNKKKGKGYRVRPAFARERLTGRTRRVCSILGLAAVVLASAVVVHSLYVIQIRDGAKYRQYAAQQLLLDTTVKATRGEIYDANGIQNAARLRQLGFAVERQQCSDDPEVITGKMQELLTRCDAVITSGGVSVGQKDYLPLVLEKLGAQLVVEGVAQKPGSPMLAATLGGKLVFCLSGNPFAAAATLEQYAIPALLRAAGRREESCIPARAVCTLTNGFSKPSKGNRYLRATACGGKVTLPGAGNTEAHSSGALSAMMGCNCLVEIPAGSGPVEPGTEVEVLCFVQ